MSGIIVNISFVSSISFCFQVRGCHGCDRMVVRFTTTYAIGSSHFNIQFINYNNICQEL